MHATRLHDTLQVPRLAGRHSRRLVYAVFVAASGALAIATITAVAFWSAHPLVVPSLGPTAFMVFNRSQTSEARPRNIVVGHLIGAVAGYVALMAFGLLHAPPVTQGGLTPARIGAAAVSIALTTGAMILLRAEHGPAGATTLIVSLGFITTISSLVLLMAGVIALAVEGVAIDRLVGLHLPYWSGQHPHHIDFAPNGSAPTSAAGSGARHDQDLPLISAPVPTLRPADGHRTDSPTSGNPPGQRWVIPPGRGRPVSVGAQECTVQVEQARSEGAYSILEIKLEPHWPAALLHAHYSFAESYLIQQGSVIAVIGHDTVRAGPGSIIHVPAGVAHQLCCAGRQPAICWCITARCQQSEPEFLP